MNLTINGLKSPLLFPPQPAWLPLTTFMGSHALGQLSMRLSCMGRSPLLSFFHKCNEKGKKKKNSPAHPPPLPLLQKGSISNRACLQKN